MHNNEKEERIIMHDFTQERRFCMIVAGFVFVRKPIVYSILNRVWYVFVFLLCPYLFATGIITVLTVPLDKDYQVGICQEVCLFVAIPWISLTAISTRSSQRKVIEHLRTGVFIYDGENEYVLKIQKSYVEQIRSINSIVYRLTLVFAVCKTIGPPAFNLMTPHEKDGLMNPYLPLRLYVPFETSSVLGFTAAFASQGLFYFYMGTMVTSHVQTYVSCALQFTAQLEVLNHSLRNIEARASCRLAREKAVSPDHDGSYYTVANFQRCFVDCIRENIQHHHAIMRLGKHVRTYIEASSGVAIVFFSLLLAQAAVQSFQDPVGNSTIILFALLIMLAYLIMSAVGQIITDKSSEVKDSLYWTPWTQCGKRFRVLLAVMMANTQTPIVLKARGFRMNISLENFADMVSVAYKIINILR